MKLTKGMIALTTPEEQAEIKAVNLRIRLKRTFNQKLPNGGVIKYWRVIGPSTHPNYMSDLSIMGLKEWGII